MKRYTSTRFFRDYARKMLVAVSEGAKMAAPGGATVPSVDGSRCARGLARRARAAGPTAPTKRAPLAPRTVGKAGARVMSFLRHAEIYRSDVG